MKKIFTIFIAIAMMLALSGVGSAAAPNNDGVVDVLYIGWNYYGIYHDMGNAPNNTYGFVNHTYIARESGEISADIIEAIENSDAEVIIVDMFFSEYMNEANPDFMNALAAKNNESETYFISVWAEDWYTGESFAPDYFAIRDTAAQTSGMTNYSSQTAWFNAMGQNGITSATDSFDDYLLLIESIAPYF